MLDINVEYNIGDKVVISKGDCIQTYFKGFDLIYLFAKKSKKEYVEYYIHDIEVTHSVKEGFKNCKFLISTGIDELKATSSGWVNGSQISKVDSVAWMENKF